MTTFDERYNEDREAGGADPIGNLVATRDTEVTHRCLCIIVWINEATGEIEEESRTNRCERRCGPDQPLCDNCHKRGHHLINDRHSRFLSMNERTEQEKS